jgi:hypothetical protein
LLELILSGRERIRIERRILLRILRCILVSGVQADSQIAIVLAIRESLSAAAFNESVHASPVLLAYTSIVPKKTRILVTKLAKNRLQGRDAVGSQAAIHFLLGLLPGRKTLANQPQALVGHLDDVASPIFPRPQPRHVGACC